MIELLIWPLLVASAYALKVRDMIRVAKPKPSVVVVPFDDTPARAPFTINQLNALVGLQNAARAQSRTGMLSAIGQGALSGLGANIVRNRQQAQCGDPENARLIEQLLAQSEFKRYG